MLTSSLPACWLADKQLAKLLRAAAEGGAGDVAQLVRRVVDDRSRAADGTAPPPGAAEQAQVVQQQAQPQWAADAGAIWQHLPGPDASVQAEVFPWVRKRLTQPPANVDKELAKVGKGGAGAGVHVVACVA